ncbi:hypothetical protein H4R34_002781 [Dimargaris verticillata]|uniref:Pentatricopeptide repeat-containing protein n=1 Tax=Dimargaris verticillata TaxID=2761393 RepID=A0A9W8EDS8_9FUNG|nr:hypothetical protein H4R34_002781 [Dimargaris verticillata]
MKPKPEQTSIQSHPYQHPTEHRLVQLLQHTIDRAGPEAGERLISELENGGYQIPLVMYNELIRLYSDQCRIHDVERWHQKLVHTVISHVQPASDTPISLSQPMAPTTVTYALLINAYNRAGLGAKAIATWQDFKSTGLPLTPPLITVILDTLGHHKKVHLLTKFWASIQPKWQAMLDENNHNSYMEALLRNQYFDHAVHHFTTQMWPVRSQSTPRWPMHHLNDSLSAETPQVCGPSRKTLVTLLSPLHRNYRMELLQVVVNHVKLYYQSVIPVVQELGYSLH